MHKIFSFLTLVLVCLSCFQPGVEIGDCFVLPKPKEVSLDAEASPFGRDKADFQECLERLEESYAAHGWNQRRE